MESEPAERHAALCRRYLQAYAAKDLQTIAALLAPGVVLRDWQLRVVGRDAALAETQRNFDAATALQIEVLRLHATAESAVAELRIVVELVAQQTVELFVVDVLDFDAQGQISAIRAYKGRGEQD
ncbi:MAG: nuclear transport factor 2 family protein [Inhella sp.]